MVKFHWALTSTHYVHSLWLTPHLVFYRLFFFGGVFLNNSIGIVDEGVLKF